MMFRMFRRCGAPAIEAACALRQRTTPVTGSGDAIQRSAPNMQFAAYGWLGALCAAGECTIDVGV